MPSLFASDCIWCDEIAMKLFTICFVFNCGTTVTDRKVRTKVLHSKTAHKKRWTGGRLVVRREDLHFHYLVALLLAISTNTFPTKFFPFRGRRVLLLSALLIPFLHLRSSFIQDLFISSGIFIEIIL